MLNVIIIIPCGCYVVPAIILIHISCNQDIVMSQEFRGSIDRRWCLERSERSSAIQHKSRLFKFFGAPLKYMRCRKHFCIGFVNFPCSNWMFCHYKNNVSMKKSGLNQSKNPRALAVSLKNPL